MSFTNQTTNYGLPQWIGTDKPTYLVDQNGAYATIDTQLYNANSNASTAVSSAASAVEVAGTAATNAQTAIDSAATANTNANSAVATANTALTNASTALARADQALEYIAESRVTIDQHTYSSTVTYETMLNTVGTAISNSVATYPLDTYEYYIEFIFDDTHIRTRLSRFDVNDVLFGSAVLGETIDIVYKIYVSGSQSVAITRTYSNGGVTLSNVTLDTHSSAVCNVYADKIV